MMKKVRKMLDRISPQKQFLCHQVSTTMLWKNGKRNSTGLLKIENIKRKFWAKLFK